MEPEDQEPEIEKEDEEEDEPGSLLSILVFF